MKVNIKRPNITQYYFDFEPCDEICTSCMWARINLDHDTFTMTATSDCGDYSYSWQVTKTESFVHLMARLNGEYLLNKISDRSVFCFDESIAEAIRLAKLYDSSDIVEKLSGIDCLDCGTEESFFRAVAAITHWEFDSIPIEKRYPAGAITFSKLFCDYLQPILRESLRGEQH